MVPLQIIILLVLVSAPAALSPGTLPTLLRFPPAILLPIFYFSHLLLVLAVNSRARTITRGLNNPVTSAAALSIRLDHLLSRGRWLAIVLTATFLFCSPLPSAIEYWLQGTRLLRHVPFFGEAVLISPALLTWIAFWTASYAFEASSRERALPGRLAQGLPVHPMPSLSQYLSMQCRHNFYIFAPVILHGTIIMIGDFLGRWIPHATEIAQYVGILVVLLLVPWILVRIWSTVPLTGPLRTQLDAVASRHRLRFRNILLWKTHNAVSNAAILGWIPISRYFLMTDALLEALTDRQIEAVFAHEVGHGVHRHILWYLASFFGGLGFAFALGVYWMHFAPAPLAHFAGEDTSSLVTMALVCAAICLGFPLISHRFEHQADWFASQHIAHTLRSFTPETLVAAFSAPAATPAEVQHFLAPQATAPESITLEQYMAGQYPHAEPAAVATVAPPPPPAPPAPSHFPTSGPAAGKLVTPLTAGAEVFISALDTIIEVSHRARDRRGWMHPSVNSRIGLLRKLSRDPTAAHLFNRRMFHTRIMIAAFVAMGIFAAVHAQYLEISRTHITPPAAPPSPNAPAANDDGRRAV